MRADIYKGLLPGENYTAFAKTLIAAGPGGLATYDVGAGQCRVISSSRSADGASWSPLQTVATPDWRDQGGDEFVELTAMAVRGGANVT